jgi:hypothetical protein
VYALYRQSLPAFTERVFRQVNPGTPYQRGWHVAAMTHELELVGRGELQRSAIAVPPRHLKSICAVVAFPAWLLGHDPSLRFLIASYGQDLAARHARDFRSVVQSGWYRRTFPNFGELRRLSEADMVTQAMGGRKAVSLGGL